MTKEISISVQNLNYSFGKGALSKQILFDVTTNIYAGEIVIVTGPSGSGKTTLLTILSALRSIKDGQVQVLGQELKGANNKTLEHVRQNIGFIFQQHNLVAALTAQQNVMLGLNVSKKFKGPELLERAKHYLHSVGLGERLHYYPEQLSGGQRQRVAIARALASEPKLLMADEPTASLDKQSGRDVVDRMKVMAKEHGTTILLVTHDNRILDIADRIVYLEDGRLSNFNQAVIDNSQQMMRIVADSHSDERDNQKGNNFEYQQLIAEISLEAQRIIALYGKLNPMAYRSVVIEGIRSFSEKIRQKLNVQMLLLFLAGTDEWQLIPFDGRSFADDVNYPVGKGLVAATKKQGKVLRIENVLSHIDFDHELDQLLQINTESVISAPLFRSSGECFAVLQIRNHVDGTAFNAEDEKNFNLYVASISVLVETYHDISNGE